MSPVKKRILVTVLVLPVLYLLWLLADGTRPYRKADGEVILNIPRGTRTREITDQLVSIGVIRSRWTFLAMYSLSWGRRTLKAGEYSFEDPVSPLQVLRKLVQGDVSYEVVVIPEGHNRFEIADIIAEHGFATREEFLRVSENTALLADLAPEALSLEGFLYPDSYHLPRHATAGLIAERMVARFREIYGEITAASYDDSALDVVIIASLVEKETSRRGERRVISGVFHNRLKRGMLLQCDPTVIYAAVLEGRSVRRLRRSDLEMDSPYNTYLHSGLPPGPIANPGRQALEAALAPDKTDYLFFVSNANGGHRFSTTLSEHNRAVVDYREILATRASVRRLEEESRE